MGTKRESPEGKITTYFQTADVLEAVLMFKVIKSILLSRGFELDGRKTAQKKSKVASAGKKSAGLKESAIFGAPEPGRYEPVDSKTA